MILPINKSEMDKAWKDAAKNGFGLYCPELGKRINIDNLIFVWKGEKEKKMRDEIALRRDLIITEKIYKEKFSDQSPYEKDLLVKDPGKFIERMIRAVEICTLKYVLGNGGGLNTDKESTVTEGRNKFLWED